METVVACGSASACARFSSAKFEQLRAASTGAVGTNEQAARAVLGALTQASDCRPRPTLPRLRLAAARALDTSPGIAADTSGTWASRERQYGD